MCFLIDVFFLIFTGSIWCATLEVKVGCSEWPGGKEYETLAYTVNLMTPADCLQGKNPNKTQMFSSGLLPGNFSLSEYYFYAPKWMPVFLSV